MIFDKMAKKTVLAFGSFDIVHPGHLSYLEKAKRLGDRLVVIVARDSSIMMFKHRKPVFSEKERVRMISALKPVDLAVLGNRVSGKEGIYRVLRRYRPDVIALGYDQRADIPEMRRRLASYGLKPAIVRIGVDPREKKCKSSRFSRLL